MLNLEMNMKITMELRPGEGGEDAKLLVGELAGIYLRYCERNRIRVSVEEAGSRL